MILKKASLLATVGSALAVGALMFAGPAAAQSGGSHLGGEAGGGMHAVLPFGPVGDSASKAGAELPLAPVGESGSKVGMELPIAPIGTAGSGRVQMTSLG